MVLLGTRNERALDIEFYFQKEDGTERERRDGKEHTRKIDWNQ